MPPSADRSLADFAAALASVRPSPGGSSAAAIPAALAAALVAMVARQTAASTDPFAELAEDMETIAAEADELRHALLAVASADILAFERVIAVRRAEAPDEIQAAYRAAVEPPLRACDLSLRVLELASEVATRGHPYTAPDAGEAALFAAAALESAALSVQLELSVIDDAAFCAARALQVESAQARAAVLRDSALEAVHEKLGPPRATVSLVQA